jgi:hypothetical protein
VSYILEALKKAAEQRDVHAPAMRRLFAPAPDMVESPRWRMALVGGAAALAGASVVSVVWLLWPTTPLVVADRSEATVATAPAETPAAVEQPLVARPPAPPAAPIVRTTPAPLRAPSERRAAPAPPRAADDRAPTDEAPVRPRPMAGGPGIASVRPLPPPAADPVPVRTPAPPAPTAGPVARAEGGSAMKLEVIVYSEERARRLAFVNGRKYVEGDTLPDGAQIQEIQPNAIVVVEGGRRVVLRP